MAVLVRGANADKEEQLAAVQADHRLLSSDRNLQIDALNQSGINDSQLLQFEVIWTLKISLPEHHPKRTRSSAPVTCPSINRPSGFSETSSGRA